MAPVPRRNRRALSAIWLRNPALSSHEAMTHGTRPPLGHDSDRSRRPRSCVPVWGRLLLLDHHGLDRGGDALVDLHDHHARADRADGLVEMDLAAVDGDAAGLLNGVDDVLCGDGAEEPSVVAGLMRDGEDGLVEQGGGLL